MEENRNGGAQPPIEVGDYYARTERPGGNGYRPSGSVMIEYHLQKAFVSIIADPVQRFAYDGGPKEIAARLEPSAEPPPVVTYFAAGDSSVTPLNVTPGEKGQCRVTVAVLPWFFPAMTGIWARQRK